MQAAPVPHPPDRRTAVPLAAGGLALCLGLLWLGPLPAMARSAFSPHMMLHLGLVGLAGPLLAALLVALRRDVAETPPTPLALAIGTAFAEMLVVWGWHLPTLHAAAARSTMLFALQQTSFLAAAALVWFVASAGRTRRDHAVGVAIMGGTFVHMTMIGLAFVLATRPLYPIEICSGAFGLSPLADQQLGGTLMAVFGGLPYLAGALLLAARALAPAAGAPDGPT